MRQEKAAQLLELALLLRGSATGLTLEDIQSHFGVSERTAHRLRDAVSNIFPTLLSEVREDQRRYWRLPKGTIEQLVDLTADDLALLATAETTLRAGGNKDGADRLKLLAAKVNSLIPAKLANRLAPDVEALMESEGIAHRPGPRPSADPHVLSVIRQAIKGGHLLRLSYRRRQGTKVERVTVQPYGVLIGARHYLIAHRSDSRGQPFLRPYSVPDIESIVELSTTFTRRADLSIREFACQAFGVYQEAPVDVVWRFSGDAVRDATRFQFHPSLTVRFTAGGQREM